MPHGYPLSPMISPKLYHWMPVAVSVVPTFPPAAAWDRIPDAAIRAARVEASAREARPVPEGDEARGDTIPVEPG